MEDSDSGVASMSSGHGGASSVGGDDRSGAGSRSSAASLALSEVSSPAPTQQAQSFTTTAGQQQQQSQPLALTVPRSSSAEPVRVWRDPQLLESSPVVRHIHSLQHHALMMAPGGTAATLTDPAAAAAAYSNLASAAAAAASHLPLLLPPPSLYGPPLPTTMTSDMWPGQQQQQKHYEEEKSNAILYRDHHRTTTGRVLRDMERGKDVDRERMAHHMQRERERDADREAEQAVDKHFEESLKKYKHSQMPWSINTIPVPHSLAAAGASPPPPLPRSSATGAPLVGSGIAPSLSISSIPPPTSSSSSTSSSGMASLNMSPSTNNINHNNNSSSNANKKGFVKTSGGSNSSKSSDSGSGGHVIDHHARGPSSEVIALSGRNGGGGGGGPGGGHLSHYDAYLAPPPPSSAAAHQMVVDSVAMAEEQQRRVLMEHHHHQQREREKEIERIRHMEQQRATYYGNAAAVAAASNVHRSPSSSAGSTNGSNKSTGSISVIPTSSSVGSSSVHNNGNPNSSAGVSIDYAHHRSLTISPSMKHMDNKQQQPPQGAVPPGHPIYAYQQHLYQPMIYHKDAKGKSEISLPAPPPLLSDVNKQSSGSVIVKHDATGGPMKSSQPSVQVIPTSSLGSSNSHNPNQNNKSSAHSPSPNHQYKQSMSSGVLPPLSQSQLLFEYRNPTGGQANIVSIHAAPRDPSPQASHQQSQLIYADRYKMQPYPSSQQQSASQRQSPAAPVGYQQQQHQQQQQRQAPSPKQPPQSDGYGQMKPKVSSPAPSHIYGKPESGSSPSIGSNNIGSAGIVTGIPVCRASTNYPPVHTSIHLVSKPNSSSSSSLTSSSTLESHQQRNSNSGPSAYAQPPQRMYGNSGPPPAHSRVFESPASASPVSAAAWAYAASANASSHSSLMHATPPVSISINPALTRSPGGVPGGRDGGAPNALQVPGQLARSHGGSHVNSVSISTSSGVVIGAHHPHVPDVQTQPLDLGTSDRSRDSMHSNNSSESKSPPAPGSVTVSLKRKSNTPIHYNNQGPAGVGGGQGAKDMKKKRYEPMIPQQQQQQQPQQSQQQHHGMYASPHQMANHQYSMGGGGGQQQPNLHPHYSLYQNLTQTGSVAIHPIPGPYLPPGHGRKEINTMQLGNTQQPPISVVMSLANHNPNIEHNSRGSPMKHQMPIHVKTDLAHDHLLKGPAISPAIVTATPVNPMNHHHQQHHHHHHNSAPVQIKMETEIEEKPKPIFTSNAFLLTDTANKPNATSPPVTPIKVEQKVAVEQVKTEVVSPGTMPVKTMHSGPRNLKKAWLQRHTGEDGNDQSSSSSSSVVTAANAPTVVMQQVEIVKPNGLNKGKALNSVDGGVEGGLERSTPVKSISAVGSMAVNSIPKGVCLGGDSPSNGNKLPSQHPKKSAAAQLNATVDKSVLLALYSDSDEKEESSSSDQEHTVKSPPKKKTAKTKRKKGGGRKPVAKKKRGTTASVTATATNASAATESDKNSDSEKESASDKDSDSGTSTSHGKHTTGSRTSNGSFGKTSPGPGSAKSDVKERRKRGRRPKVTKEEPSKKKQSKQEQQQAAANAQADENSLVNKFKKSGETFLQELACHEMERLSMCRECRLPPNQRNKAFCRFYAFRRLRYNKNGQLAVFGFSDPKKDPDASDMQLWNPDRESPPTNLDLSTAKLILMYIVPHLCKLLSDEMNELRENLTQKQAWKKVVNGMREMCDVCETTLFNLHWSCNRCGFAVCLDCYKSRRDDRIKFNLKSEKGYDDHGWLLCTNGREHDTERLMATQIMTGKTLVTMDRELHDLCNIYDVNLTCYCFTSDTVPRKFLKAVEKVAYMGQMMEIPEESEESDGPLSVLADVALHGGRLGRSRPAHVKPDYDYELLKVCRDTLFLYKDRMNESDSETRRNYRKNHLCTPLVPPAPLNAEETKQNFPDIPHSWLCDGKLLRLHDPRNKDNYKMFCNPWRRGQPVLVSNVTKKLTRKLWTPESFAADFGHRKHDVVNCINGEVISNLPMRKFWDGFDAAKRPKDDKGQPMLLKLKDWPPDENFATMLPERFDDLMAALPLPEYTHRNGNLNLAGRLPGCFVRPDLGPKMYNAYGSALHPTKGTTNLHMDISDAVNVMVYVGIPKGVHTEETKEAFRAIDEAGCDILTRRRVRDKGEVPGALWHIYAPTDADKIRDLLREVATERGEPIEVDSDPIHDQNWYLDGPLRERLYKTYGVEGYPIAQCLGDAIFIPAGAPHQVRNLHNCIKVAEDFVSPENIGNCIKLTDEFRQLSESHQNREDKLQIKNILYHAAKDCLSYLYHRLMKAANWCPGTEKKEKDKEGPGAQPARAFSG